jgi:hypothetical protein
MAVAMLAVLVLTSPGYSTRLLPTVKQMRRVCSFCGRSVEQMRRDVTNLDESNGVGSFGRLASGREEASLRRADEVVNGNALAWAEVVSTEGVNSINDDSSTGSGGGSNHRRAPAPRTSSVERFPS